ncbi:MAG: LysR family transcriptional regulator [Firmicutes bacterium]|nr:LysR family transcriptional regulator [Bacillota bacterium]
MFNKNINLNLYKVFYDVCKYGSFTKTAEYTYTTQSAISKSIKKLEEDLETQLFYRNSNGIELTDKGRELFYYVEKSYGNLLTAERIMLETENLERGKLNIGLPSHIASFFFFDKIIEFHEKYPNIEMTLISASTGQLLDLIDKHEIDIIIDTAPINTNNKDLCVIELLTVKYGFICTKNNYDKYKHIKSIKDLEDVPLILPIKGTTNRKKLDSLFIKCNTIPKKIINIHTSEVILNAVNNNLGIGYIISDIVKNNDDYRFIDIKEELPTADIVFAYDKKFLTTAPKRFIEEYINYEIE